MEGKAVITSRRSSELTCVHIHMYIAYVCRWLAYTLECVDVALAVGAGVCHILEVVNQAGDQAASQITPHTEADETEECVHHTNFIRNAGDNCLMAM